MTSVATRHDRSYYHCGGMTLIEMLAVIAIASFIAAAITANLASADRGGQILRAIASVQDMDNRGRALARTTGDAVKLTVDQESGCLVLISRGEIPLTQMRLPSEARLELNPASIVFDRQGRSSNYTARVKFDEVMRTFGVNGLTGFIQEQVP